MSVTDIGPHKASEVAVFALEEAEARLMPEGSYSRIIVALEVARSTTAYLAYPCQDARLRLALALDGLRELEGNLCAIDSCYPVEQYPERTRQLDPSSIVGRAFALATHIAQAALAEVDSSVSHVLDESRMIARLSAREAA